MIEIIYKSPSRGSGHTEYKLQAKEYKKKITRYANKDITIRQKQPRVNWSASSSVIFTRSGI